MQLYDYSPWIAGGIALFYLVRASSVQAQVSPDDTLSTPTNVTTSDNLNFTITDGTRAGNNLFHSFREFSVPTNGSAVFNNPAVKNIISRVTGGAISNIDGLIQANNTANLFLINPNGIIFGSNASLDIGSSLKDRSGSFVASTASGVLFSDGTQFSATASQTPPLLTVSVPIGLQFGGTAGPILTRGSNLRVGTNSTLALVGGDLKLEGGMLRAPVGRIELGSVAEPGLVSLTPIAGGWTLGYEDIKNFQNIQLSQEVSVNASASNFDEGSGDIQVQGKRVELTDFSSIRSVTGDIAGGSIFIQSEQLILRDGSEILVGAFGIGRAGDLSVISNSVELIGTDTSDNPFPSGLFTVSFERAAGNAGNLIIDTGRLIVREGAAVSASTAGAGQGGNVFVSASEFVEVSGRSAGGRRPSGLSAQSIGGQATGNAGKLEIDTRQLIVQNGATIGVGAIEETIISSRIGVSQGQGGELRITASDSVEVSGAGIDENGQVVPSTLLAESQGPGDAGNLTIETGRLIVKDGGRISAETTEAGTAGDVTINTIDLTLKEGAEISASTVSGQGGDIALENLDTLEVINSQISASTEDGTAGSVRVNASESVQLVGEGGLEVEAKGSGSAGSLTVDTPQLTLQEGASISASTVSGQGGDIILENLDTLEVINSQISASTEDGTAGSVRVNANESVQLVGEGGLAVEATEGGTAGNLTVETGQFTISDGARVTVSSPEGQAGNVDITAHSLGLNRGNITAETGVGQGEEGANITLKVSDLLMMSNESRISAEAFDTADGGNINIDAKFVVAIPAENSDIIANAFEGRGGKINITTQGIFGLESRDSLTPLSDITASSEFGLDGIIEINRPEVDPTKELVELPEKPVNVARLIDQKLCAAGQGSEFTVIGRGGLPDSPNQALKPDAAWEDWRIEESSEQEVESQQSLPVQTPASTPEQATSDREQEKIVEFRGWAINARGNLVLTAEPNTVTPKGVLLPPPGCQQLTEKLSSR